MPESSTHLSAYGAAPRVWLIGAGPGDPGLLTVRARELLERCDCVVHDQLVNPAILALAPAAAPRHDVGKRGGATSRPQDEINALLVELAARHRCVVRLKGGDPFVFGRGGEEALTLARAGLAFGVVPGVTSGVAVPAYAGIPVTHRAASSAVVFVTGHQRRSDPEPPAMDWAAFAKVETIVLYMGMHKLAENCSALIEHGRDGATPAAIIQWGTYPTQRVVTGTLATIPRLAHDAAIGAPAITVVGDVVRHREAIAWYVPPLAGRTALVTRAEDDASALAEALERAGATVHRLPLAEHRPPPSWAALDAALDLDGWLCLTSRAGVRFLFQRLAGLGRDARALARFRLAVVGPGTATALARHGLTPDLIAEGSGADLARALIDRGAQGRAVLVQAEQPRPELADGLCAAGWSVYRAPAYGTDDRSPPLDFPWVSIDLVPLASAATAQRLAQHRAHLPATARVIAIGPTTAAAASAAGFSVAATASAPTIDAVVAACIAAAGPTP